MSTVHRGPAAGSPGPNPASATDLPPNSVDPQVLDHEQTRWTPLRIALWAGIALLGGVAWVMIAFALTVPIANIAVPVLAAAGFTHLFHLLSGSVDRAP